MKSSKLASPRLYKRRTTSALVHSLTFVAILAFIYLCYAQGNRRWLSTKKASKATIRIPIADPLAHVVDERERAAQQAAMVKAEMKSAWMAYKRYAWGHDELKPVSKSFIDWGGVRSKGVALTAVDSLSTLWLMDLHEEFADAVRLVTEEVDYDQKIAVSAFEYTIRVVGGLLSAYELSGEVDTRLLNTAQRVMDKLLVAYNTSTGIPHQTCNLKEKTHWGVSWSKFASILSEFGSVQLELRTLSYHTKNPIYDIKATHIMDITETQCKTSSGLCPTYFDFNTATVMYKDFSLGANSDSYYEYLLKQYLLTGRTEERYARMALEALDGALTKLLKRSPNGEAYFDFVSWVGFNTLTAHQTMDHLACFAGGLYALAAEVFPNYKHANIYRKVAEEITETCNMFYESQPSGLAPERIVFNSDGSYNVSGNENILRPEAVESMFYHWRYTRDPKYREWAWQIFLSFLKYSKVPSGGFSGMVLDQMPPEADDKMQSFFLAETLKYLYLIFSEDEVLDLSSWVLNTEAHPLKIRHRDPLDIWREWEQSHDGVPAYLPPTLKSIKIRTETEQMRKIRVERKVIKAPIDPLALEDKPSDQ